MRNRFDADARRRAAEALHPTSDRARRRLEQFVQEGGAMITTGQQAGLFTGPIYTLYKALTAARLAGALEERLGQLVIPVFWVASEDHDWNEVNHAVLSVPGAGTRRLELAADTDRPLPVSDRQLTRDIQRILDESAHVLRALRFSSDAITLIRGAYREGRSVAEAFAAMLRELLAPFDFCLTDASDPALKRASVPVLKQAVVEAERHERVLEERTREIQEAGYGGQVAVLDGGVNLFVHTPEGRFRLFREGSGFVVPESGARFTEAELLDRIESDAASFSPNVFLRPVVETWVLPTLSYVGGPGEIAYFAQITALFEEFGVRPPVVYPRASLVLIEPAMSRLLEKVELELADLRRPRHELVEELAQRAMPEDVREALEALSRTVTEGYRRLIEAGTPIDPTLGDALASLRNQVLARVEDSERKVVRQLKRRSDIAVGQLERLLDNLSPDGQPQDRVLNVLPFIAREGMGLVEEIAGRIRVEMEG